MTLRHSLARQWAAAGAVLVGLLAGPDAWARSPDQVCPPLHLTELSALLAAQDEVLLASEEPDIAEHSRISEQIRARLPCASFLIAPATVRQLAVGEGLRNWHIGANWVRPITAALRIPTDGDALPVRPGHPLTEFVSADPPAPVADVPEGVELYINGQRVTKIAPLDALSLIQRPYGDSYQTELVESGDVPRYFLSRSRLPKAVRDARRRSAARGIGTAVSAVLVASGGVAWGMGHVTYAKFRDPDTDPVERQALIDKGRPLVTSGIVLTSVGAAGIVGVWVTPW